VSESCKSKDLIEILQKVDPNLEVYSYDEEGDFTAVQPVDGVTVMKYTMVPQKVLIHGGYP